MDLEEGIGFARSRNRGVIVTRRRDGRPHLSNIVYAIDGTGVARISTSDATVKAKNARRDPAASLYVPGDSFWAYVVLDGGAELSPAATDPNDAVVDELVELYRTINGGDHPDWDEFRSAMVDERRLVFALRAEHAYGAVRG